ncbi:MAG: FAD-binding oxidoreductase [Rhodocyclaceae bacterium]|jgi:alkyldihydroxyacetonephosphate synthase|nr:FAD-binding oxidoreductase [Rhodocyclaceae bacterium]
MRRWNGWGDDTITTTLAPDARGFLETAIGQATATTDATLAEVCARIDREQPSRFLAVSDLHPLVITAAEDRLRSGFGQSMGDWLRLRFGQLERITDGVAYPERTGQVRELLDWAASVDAVVIPCGGATSVAGHLAVPANDSRPVLTLNMSRLRALIALDETAQLARFQTGVAGPDLEAQLRARGFMLGHFPQSFDYATLGGWVTTRSSGQQSLRYGRIEQLFAGGTLETPSDTLTISPFPASAAGLDLREWVLGSEGRLGVLTEATVRVMRLPEAERFIGIFLPSWEAGVAATRALAQGRVPLSMLRLANPTETLTTLRLAGHAGQIAWLERYLAWRGAGEGKCLMFIGLTGTRRQVRDTLGQAMAIVRQHGGVSTGSLLGKKWAKNRFAGVYLRNTLWATGYAVDTMETAVPWTATTQTMQAMEEAGRKAFAAFGERCHTYTHLSHVYATGSSVYTTFVFRLAPDFAGNWARWVALKRAVSAAIVASGGTISHQHGVGRDHAPYLPAEKGAAGMAAIGAAIRHFDPQGLMASGNLTEGPTW